MSRLPPSFFDYQHVHYLVQCPFRFAAPALPRVEPREVDAIIGRGNARLLRHEWSGHAILIALSRLAYPIQCLWG